MPDLGFPLWVRLTHLFNILFLSLLVRSGIEILGGHPMLYWNDHCTPGTEWIRFTNKKMPKDTLWTAEDEKQPYSPWIALPGHDNLGVGRYWHFASAIGWLVVGIVYITLMFATPQWRTLVPTSWDVFPGALHAARIYLQFRIPETQALFNPLQQLAYFGLIFILSPLQILTGLAMSPAIAGRFPWYPRLFGGRQSARSIHFLGLVAYLAFTVHHTALVIAHGFGPEVAMIVLGDMNAPVARQHLAIAIGAAFVIFILAFHVWATVSSLNDPRRVQHLLMPIVDPVRITLLGHLNSRQRYRRDQITPHPRPNGRPPRNRVYQELVARDFRDWRFEVDGLVEQQLSYSLEELRALPSTAQITEHCCIQGWSYVAEWQGVRVAELLDRCRPRPDARYLLFETFDEKWEASDHGLGNFYSVIDLEQARKPQAILAWGMNGRALPPEFGAPLRLRLESQLGFKMAKFVCRLTLISDYADIGAGHANWRADYLHYSPEAPI